LRGPFGARSEPNTDEHCSRRCESVGVGLVETEAKYPDWRLDLKCTEAVPCCPKHSTSRYARRLLCEISIRPSDAAGYRAEHRGNNLEPARDSPRA
jgi:hypothetical protein